MTDWAEARSRFLLMMWFPGGHAPNQRRELAVAIRQARTDALEEAAAALAAEDDRHGEIIVRQLMGKE